MIASACSSQTVTAPTVVVAPSPVVTAAATGALGPVQIAMAQVLPQDALIVLQNTGGPNQPTTIDLQNYKLQVGTVTVTLPTGAKIAPGQNLALHAGPQAGVTPSPGTTVSPVPANLPNAELYLGPDAAALRDALKPGAAVQLRDPKGIIVSQFTIPGG
ncbi:MAG: hypothetical protein NVSMB2_14510 [Chloroflexota bacterium]